MIDVLTDQTTQESGMARQAQKSTEKRSLGCCEALTHRLRTSDDSRADLFVINMTAESPALPESTKVMAVMVRMYVLLTTRSI